MNKKIKRLLKSMQEMPGAFFGKKSIERLAFSISGYALCLYENGELDENQPLPGFNEFVAQRYGVKSAHDWCSIIVFYHPVEEDAFDTFYKLLDEFYGKD